VTKKKSAKLPCDIARICMASSTTELTYSTIFARSAQFVLPSEDEKSSKDVDFLRVDCYNVALGISNQANEWKNDYGEVLQITSKKLLDACVAEMDLFAKELKFDPSNLEDLKFVLNVVTRIADRSMDMELMYLDIVEVSERSERALMKTSIA